MRYKIVKHISANKSEIYYSYVKKGLFWRGINHRGDLSSFKWDRRTFSRENALDRIDSYHTKVMQKLGEKIVNKTTEYIIKNTSI